MFFKLFKLENQKIGMLAHWNWIKTANKSHTVQLEVILKICCKSCPLPSINTYNFYYLGDANVAWFLFMSEKGVERCIVDGKLR